MGNIYSLFKTNKTKQLDDALRLLLNNIEEKYWFGGHAKNDYYMHERFLENSMKIDAKLSQISIHEKFRKFADDTLGKIEEAMKLISAGANPNLHSSRGLATIHYLAILVAMDSTNKDKYENIIQELVSEHHVNVNKRSAEKRLLLVNYTTVYMHPTPMEYFLQALETAYYGDYKNGLILIRAGADSTITDSNNHTLMWHLLEKDYKEAADELIDILNNNNMRAGSNTRHTIALSK